MGTLYNQTIKLFNYPINIQLLATSEILSLMGLSLSARLHKMILQIYKKLHKSSLLKLSLRNKTYKHAFSGHLQALQNILKFIRASFRLVLGRYLDSTIAAISRHMQSLPHYLHRRRNKLYNRKFVFFLQNFTLKGIHHLPFMALSCNLYMLEQL